MPNKPDIYKRLFNLRIDREIYEKVRKIAKTRKCTMTDVVKTWIIENTSNVNLTSEEREEISSQIQKASEDQG